MEKKMKVERVKKYHVTRPVYNSYLYIVENDISPLDKFSLHGTETSQFLDGGSAYHCNLEEYPSKETFKKLMRVAAVEGCNYYCFNIKVTCCEDCGHIDKQTRLQCSKCGSKNITYATRVIGYLKKISSFSQPRKVEESKRLYHTKESA